MVRPKLAEYRIPTALHNALALGLWQMGYCVYRVCPDATDETAQISLENTVLGELTKEMALEKCFCGHPVALILSPEVDYCERLQRACKWQSLVNSVILVRN